MESYIFKEGKDSANITIPKKGCIHYKVVVDYLCSSAFVLKYGLEMYIERGSTDIRYLKTK